MPAVHAPPTRHFLLLATLALSGASYSLLQSLVAPALPELQRELGASPTAVAWIFTAYLLSASIAAPIAGRIGDMFGKKKTLLFSIGALAVGSLIAALATTLPLMIGGRAIQGIGGAVFPLAYGIIRDELPRERVASGIALISTLLGIGGGLGIILSGPIIAHLSYHWLFWIPLIAVIVAGAATLLFVPESQQRTPGRISWAGAALLSAWLVCLLLGVSEGPRWGWASGPTLGLFATTAVLVVAWVRVEERAPVPLVDMRMLRLRGVWTTNLATLLIGYGMFATFILVPQFVELPRSTGFGFGASVTQAGLFLLPASVAMLVVSPLTGRISNAIGAKLPLVLGAAISTASFLLLAFAHSEPWQLYVATTVMGIGIGFAFASMTNLIVEAVPREQTGVASGMNSIMRSIGSSIGSQLSASIIAGNLLASGLPGERGFTLAFALCAAVLIIGTGAAVAVPARLHRSGAAA
jgi:EmrB/QacA subfamily drug resistance transporter